MAIKLEGGGIKVLMAISGGTFFAASLRYLRFASCLTLALGPTLHLDIDPN